MPGLDQLMLSGTSTWLRGHRFPEGLLGSARIDGGGPGAARVSPKLYHQLLTKSLCHLAKSLESCSPRAVLEPRNRRLRRLDPPCQLFLCQLLSITVSKFVSWL